MSNMQDKLLEAIRNHDYLRCAILLQSGKVDVEGLAKIDDIFGVVTPLTASIMYSAKEVFHLLIDHGASVNGSEDFDVPPLYDACYTDDNLEIVETLIIHGADVNYSTRDSDTPLHVAASGNAPKIIKHLIRSGANPNTADRYHKSPLLYAIKFGHMECVHALVECGADVNYEPTAEKHPLHYSVVKGNAKALEYLIEHGGNLSYTDLGDNLLDIAIRHQSKDCIQVLQNHGLSPSSQRKDAMNANN